MRRKDNREKHGLKIRSAFSGKLVSGKDVILCTEALEFVKKQGYEVFETVFSKIKKPEEVSLNLGDYYE